MQKRHKPDDAKQLQRIRMRLRFKRLVRTVIMNIQFMDDDEQGMTMNVRRNVAFLIRQKRKTGILTIKDKSLLRSSPSYRSVADRRELCMIVAGLNCMARLPPKLRARLAPHLKYEFIHPDRVVIREDNDPMYVYFLISGEIEVKKSVYDRKGKKSQVSEAIMGPGDWIGDVEILEKCPRLNTYVTISQCEILSITDHVFKEILGDFMKKQWHDKKQALSSLSYFNFLTESQIVRACSFSQLIQFDPLTSIFSENHGAWSCVHFILSGECVILQILKMQVNRRHGVAKYKLTHVDEKPSSQARVSRRSIETDFQYEQAERDLLLDDTFHLGDLLESYPHSDEELNTKKTKGRRKVGLQELEAKCRQLEVGEEVISERKIERVRRSHRQTYTRISLPPTQFQSTDSMEEQLCDELFEYLIHECVEEAMSSIEDWDSFLENRNSFGMMDHSRKPSHDLEIIHFPTLVSRRGTMLVPETPSSSSSSSSKGAEELEPPSISEIETHFIEVGSLSYGGVFGLGEQLTHRCIMARTNVQCLQLPRFWLMEEDQNPGHIWQRRRFYLEQCIPSREELFNNFLKTRSWEKFKEKYVQSILDPSTVSGTKVEDIPIISRIVEHC